MNGNSENIQRLQLPVQKNLDEMSKQTLDALKVVHSFESKPARSEKIREILEKKSSQNNLRSPLQSIRPTSSPERRFQGSPRTLRLNNVEANSGTKSMDKSNVMRISNCSKIPHTGIAPKISDTKSIQQPILPKPSAAKLNHASLLQQSRSKHLPRGTTKSTLNPNGSSAIPALRTKGSSATYTGSSRLLQPTAASVAKVNQRVLPRPASRGPIYGSASANTSFANDKSLGNPGPRPNITPKPPVTAAINATNASNRSVAGNRILGKSNTGENSIGLKPTQTVSHQHNGGYPRIPLLQPLPQFSTQVMKPASIETTTPESKTNSHFSQANQTSQQQVNTINPTLLMLDNSKQSNSNPATTSTPVRSLNPLTEGDSTTMHSIDFSNFSNFSYVADWAKTPELAKKALEQQNVDTLRLFGSIPPVDIDAIFGGEIKRQQRHQ